MGAESNTNKLLEIIANELYVARLEREEGHSVAVNPVEVAYRVGLLKKIDTLREEIELKPMRR